ncbi:MAG: ribonuclease P protein component [Candidatus Zambryskibacteria bacterium CG10_big_fil_rev_8_21_14_0_10_42_12]|uniref:Ribonuclease P protein component n=1 Tax=Candidatus Zambryskibacteria bacterium CG10_big_fil_rev_8_21_14_0_10_42_12 TaxID=1975115 RepID=A0A2H0QUN6_9BACT|nr:MAG: ribonuclease P protein component [Candidatus Zambryskibacteria bacterium CG10_big_fil_rev_8_21_14_0_10_42_12]
MLPKTKRLSRKEFGSVYNLGKRLNTSLFSVIFHPAAEAAKFGIVVSKKVTKKAVARHKVRRWVYEAIRSYLKQHESFKHDVIFITHPSIMKETYRTVETQVHHVLQNLSH